jgi:hypothetical protein
LRLADRFRSVLIPRRRAGRKSKAHVTAAYQDWKAGVHLVKKQPDSVEALVAMGTFRRADLWVA